MASERIGLLALVSCTAAMCACGAGVSARPLARPAADPWGTVWLCRPGLAHNPCTSDETVTVVGPSGAAHVQRISAARSAPVDCFYVYPTVSVQQTTNANLEIDPQERAVAVAQASRFASVCTVYAPMPL